MNELNTPAANKIALWAIDPYELETRPNRAAQEELQKWAVATETLIQPVHVLEHGAQLVRSIPAIEEELTRYLSTMSLPMTLTPRVLVQPGGSKREAVDILTKYATDEKAGWILVSSKGKSGLGRLTAGSFAETLLLHSRLPVWVFGHGAPKTLDPASILFATDFSDASRSAFDQVLEQAARLRAQVTFVYCIDLPVGILSGVAASAVFPPADYMNTQLEWANGVAKEWIARAAQQGVVAKFVIRENVPNISNEILAQAAQAKAGFIAMASTCGPAGAALLGSHARQVVRQAECPVWVFGKNSQPAPSELKLPA